MEARFSQILAQFQLSGAPVSCERYGFGHINETYLVVTDTKTRYILQKINDHYPKYILTLDEDPDADYDGIRRINALEWLLKTE